MDWRGRRQSRQVEDRRGVRVRRIGRRGSAVGVGGALLIVVVALLLGKDPRQLVSTLDQRRTAEPPATAGSGARDDEAKRFVSVVLADTEDTWRKLLAAQGESYRLPKLVLFTDQVRSACGFASAAVGPFYCRRDQKVYLDLGFFDELRTRFSAPGDFAQAYVIAHEVGHHVQHLLGISDRVARQRARSPKREANALSVRLELQADCLAGVWGHHAGLERRLLEAGDVEEGLRAAAAIGDDRLQRQARGFVVPDSFTHGSSAERQRWLRRGLESGSLAACDTFGAR